MLATNTEHLKSGQEERLSQVIADEDVVALLPRGLFTEQHVFLYDRAGAFQTSQSTVNDWVKSHSIISNFNTLQQAVGNAQSIKPRVVFTRLG